MKSFKPLLIFIFWQLLISCSSQKNETSESTTTDALIEPVVVKGLMFEERSQIASGIEFTEFVIDTLSSPVGHGILISGIISPKSEVFEDLKHKGYSGLYIQLTCISDNGKNLCTNKNLNNNSLITNRNQYLILSPSSKKIEELFYFHDLEMYAGKHDIKIHIEVLPIKYSADSQKSDIKEIQLIANLPIAEEHFRFNVNSPRLHKIKIEIDGFRINTKVCDPSKFDFTLGGTGYPDLFWDVTCGNTYVFHSPEVKNTIEYKKKHSTPEFFCTEKDIIKIRFADYDNGPFNTQHDLIDTWEGTIADLPETKTSWNFGNVENLILRKIETGSIASGKQGKNK
ncbi:MAG: hypothetical protein ACK40G_05895 [Cytophagaceae bacterium]